jgi:hypothetical protein
MKRPKTIRDLIFLVEIVAVALGLMTIPLARDIQPALLSCALALLIFGIACSGRSSRMARAKSSGRRQAAAGKSN